MFYSCPILLKNKQEEVCIRSKHVWPPQKCQFLGTGRFSSPHLPVGMGGHPKSAADTNMFEARRKIYRVFGRPKKRRKGLDRTGCVARTEQKKCLLPTLQLFPSLLLLLLPRKGGRGDCLGVQTDELGWVCAKNSFRTSAFPPFFFFWAHTDPMTSIPRGYPPERKEDKEAEGKKKEIHFFHLFFCVYVENFISCELAAK